MKTNKMGFFFFFYSGNTIYRIRVHFAYRIAIVQHSYTLHWDCITRTSRSHRTRLKLSICIYSTERSYIIMCARQCWRLLTTEAAIRAECVQHASLSIWKLPYTTRNSAVATKRPIRIQWRTRNVFIKYEARINILMLV